MKLNKEDIFPAAPVPEAVPPTVARLEELISERGDSFPLWFALGNVLLREGRFAESVEALKKAVAVDGQSGEANHNLGVAFAALGRNDEALSQFRQAILLKPTSALPHLHSGRVQIDLQQLDAARLSFERASKLDPAASEPLLRLAELAEGRGEQEEALRFYRQVFDVGPALAEARMRLARDCFERGKALFVTGDIEGAFRVWADGSHEFSPAFSVDQIITGALAELERSYVESGDLNTVRELFASAQRMDPENREQVYPLFARFLFSIGLMPECFETRDGIEKELSRWRASLESLGEHPYPHFRIGLLHAYAGRIVDAEDELRNCQDKLPPKKAATLKLSKILDFISELKELEQKAREGAVALSADWEWEKAGFANPFEIKQWKQSGLAPDVAKAWRESGFTGPKAKVWAREKILPVTARIWLDAGVVEPKVAKKWVRAGASPEDAKKWNEHFGENVEQAIQCRNVGFEDAALAAEWLRVVLFPWDAIRWHEARFTPSEAREWLEQGVTDPFAAADRRSKLAADASGEQD